MRRPAGAVVLLMLIIAAATGCGGDSKGQEAIALPSDPETAAPSPSPTPRLSPSPSPRPSPTRVPTVLPTRRPPVAAAGRRYVFPIQGCTASYSRSHHHYPATDIFAARGCTVVAPVSGRVDEVSTVDRWVSSTNKGADRGGLAVSIVGDDGVRYYGSHLSTITSGVRPGKRVQAGEPIGRVGTSGSARGTSPHLHFGISWPAPPGFWWVRRGAVHPWPYLDAWRAGRSSSPAAAVAAERARQGTTPPCRGYC